MMREMIANMGDFMARHWGDCVGLGLLWAGIGLILLHAQMSGDWSEVKTTGTALVLAAVGVLRLVPKPKPNGNGPTS